MMFYNSLITLLCVTGLVACNSMSPQETATHGNGGAGFSGATHLTAPDLLIQFHSNVSEWQARQIIVKHQSKVIKVLTQPGLYQIQMPSGMTASDAIRVMQGLPEVRFVEPNARRQHRS